MKTKTGDYLKDGFVVDSDESEVLSCSDTSESVLDNNEGIDENTEETPEDQELLEELDMMLSDGSELEEEEYEYSDE